MLGDSLEDDIIDVLTTVAPDVLGMKRRLCGKYLGVMIGSEASTYMFGDAIRAYEGATSFVRGL
eukprot:1421563-Alexandrium_andersonii.AAC.1